MLDINDLDRTDLRLLAELQRDASLSNLELADKVGLSPTPCARRVKRLLTEGFIERQVAILNPEKLGFDLTAHVSICGGNYNTISESSLFESMEKYF